ncbi:hypothetical protein F5148DRAFT_195407, partial [Russula earlei]
EAAKAACAADAITEGILDFIKFGNGQIAPAERRLFPSQEDDVASAETPVTLTLQGFFEALPRPLPEPVDEKSVAEINAPGWLNTLIQSARGGKLEHKFIWTTDTKLGTHGAVLRLTRPGEVRTYMVEPQFPKRADAKNAVCLAALAAGIGAHVRAISAALEAKISPGTRTLVMECVLPLLTTEYGRYWPNRFPEMFEYTKDRDACGCIMTLKLTEQPEERERRSWTVPTDFRNKNDAKIAVLQLAFEQGAIEFLRFRGELPPRGYKVELPPLREARKAKRKGTDGVEDEGESSKKKPKLISQAEQFLAATLPSKSTEVRASGSSDLSQGYAAMSTAAMLLPRPGYVDPKLEPGELPAEPPKLEPEYFSTPPSRRPPTQPYRQTREYSFRHSAELSRQPRCEPGRTYPYDPREHGRQYELGDAWHDGSGVYASDPYYASPPARHTEPWHASPSFPAHPDEDRYGRSRYDDGYDERGYGYDYEWDQYSDLPPHPVTGPAARGYHDFEGPNHDYSFAYEQSDAHARSHIEYPRHEAAEIPAVPMSMPQRGAPPSPPRVWEPGPHAGVVSGRRTGAARLQVLPPSPLPRSCIAALEPGPVAGAESAASSSWSSSSTPTPAGSLPNVQVANTEQPTPTSEPSLAAPSSKEELFELIHCSFSAHVRASTVYGRDE